MSGRGAAGGGGTGNDGPGGGGGGSGGGRGGATGGGGRGGRTGGPGGGSDPGNAGGGRSPGSGGGGPGRDTPGAPDASDGRRGSSMGRDGGLAGGRGVGSGAGSNTPGDPSTPGRRSQNAEGTTAASRARSAMDRHSKEASDRDRSLLGSVTNALSEGFNTVTDTLGLGDEEGVTTESSLRSLRSLDPTLTNAELSGMILGDENASLEGAINADTEASALTRAVSAFATVTSGIPGAIVGQVGEAGDSARRASNTIDSVNTSIGMNMDSDFGTSMGMQARGAAADGVVGTTVGGLLGPAAAKAGGKAGAMFAGAAADKAGDMASNTAMTGEMSPSPSIGSDTPGRASTGGTMNGTASGARGAMSVASSQTAQTSAPETQGFEWAPINMGVYGNGLLRNFT